MMNVDAVYEALTILSLLMSGRALARAHPNNSRWAAICVWGWSVGFGIAAAILTFGITSVMKLNSPAVVAIPLALALFSHAACDGVRAALKQFLRSLPAGLALSLGAVLIAESQRLGGYTYDSFVLIARARAMARNRAADAAIANPLAFESYPSGYALLQIPSSWGGHAANHGLGVLLAFAILALLGQALHEAQQPPSTVATIGILGLLSSTHFFWVMTFYINSHAVVALLLLATYIQLRVSTNRLLDQAPLMLMISSLVLLRVENLLLVALLLATRVGFGRDMAPHHLRTLRVALAVTGATGLANQTVVLVIYHASADWAASRSSLGLTAVAAVLILAAVVAPHLVRSQILPVRGSIQFLLLANVAYAVLTPWAFLTSALATAQNLFMFHGGWGIMPPLLLGLIVASAFVLRSTDEDDSLALLSFLVAAALFFFFTGFLRETPFRVGAGDSLNRQLFHLVPLGLLAIGRAIGVAESRRSIKEPGHLG